MEDAVVNGWSASILLVLFLIPHTPPAGGRATDRTSFEWSHKPISPRTGSSTLPDGNPTLLSLSKRKPRAIAKAKAKTNVTSRWIVIAHQPHAALGGLTLGSGGTPSFLFVWIPEQVPAWSAFPTSDRAARGQPFNIVLRRLQTKTDSFFQPPLPPSPTNALSEGRASLWCVSGGGPRWCARVVAWTARLTAAFPCPWRSSPWPRR